MAFDQRRVRGVVSVPVGIGAIVVAVCVAAAWVLFPKGEDTTQFLTATAMRGDVEQAITALATLLPSEFVDVGAQVSGQLKKIHVKPGHQVEQGQLLAEIDATLPQAKVQGGRAQLQSLRAQLNERRAQLRLAEQIHTRQQRLMQARATSEETVQNAEASLRAAEAQVAALQAQIEQTESTLRADEASLSYTRILAPISGTVLSLSARQGQALNANQQAPIIMRIADLGTMTVLAQVSEADVVRLKPGMDAYFTTLGRKDRRWQGKLRQILPNPDVLNGVVLFNAQFEVDNEDRQLLPQMSAQVFFVQAQAKDAIVVPITALSGGKGTRATVRVMKDGTIEEREVVVGVRNRVRAEIVSGLAEGETVVTGLKIEEARAASPSTKAKWK